ncbi:MAG TPA: hypothetical protein VNV41_19690 [Candidatus Acidoferrales bacterium]|nr:hypothetical protein [Candidatus Acidoferrales bacterium]
MAIKHSSKPEVPVDANAGYEKRDANAKGLLLFAFWMAVVLAVTLVGMRLAFDAFKKSEPLGATASPMVKSTDRMLPPSPRLQVQPHLELWDYCAAQQKEVNTYAWVDRPSGVVRIPIDRAMELVLERGLPTRPAGDRAAASSSTAVTTPTVAGETDIEGQCGYLAEPTQADIERNEKDASDAK